MKTHHWISAVLLAGSLVDASPSFAAQATKAQATYDATCAACHGSDGAGSSAMPTIPRLSNPDFLSMTSSDMLKGMIENGRPGRPMPPWKGALSPAQIAGVAAYIKSWQTLPEVHIPAGKIHGNARSGKQIFFTVCASCHGLEGRGESAPALNNAGFLKAATDGYLKKTIELGRAGTSMRSFEGANGLANLDDQEINDVVAYIRSWQKK